MNKSSSRIRWILGLAGALVLGTQLPAHAYIDPQSGSYIFQVIIGALVGAVVSVKVFWHRIVGLFGKVRSRKG